MAFLKNISTPGTTDAELVTQYRRTGDTAVLGTLYERYMDLVYGVCLKYLKNPEASKDAVMQVFEELVQKVHKHEIGHFRSWLFALAKNHCLMQLRTPKNLRTVEFDPAVMQSGEQLHLDDVLLREGQLQQLEQCLETLSREQQESVSLFYLQQKCYREIAVITGHDWNKVKSFIQNGRRNLKTCMEEKK